MTNLDLTPLFEAVLGLIGVIITYYAIPWIKSKTSNEQQTKINTWVRVAVQAAEQLYKETGTGEEKKAHVIAFLEAQGVKLTATELDELIEAAVYELKQGVL